MAVNTFGVPLWSSGDNYNQVTLYKKVFDFIILDWYAAVFIAYLLDNRLLLVTFKCCTFLFR